MKFLNILIRFNKKLKVFMLLMDKSLTFFTALLFGIIFSANTVIAQNGPARPLPGQETEPNNKAKSIEWLNIEEVQEKVKEEPRKVFIDVYTDWCGWCKKMDKETFAAPEVVEYVSNNYYAVKMDAESKDSVTFHDQTLTKRELARSLRVQSFPTIIFFNEELTRFQPAPGYRNAEQFKKILMQFNGDLDTKKQKNGGNQGQTSRKDQ